MTRAIPLTTRPAWLLILAALACGPALASEIYRTTDEDGNVVFTDDPPSDDAEPVELDPLTTVPGTPTGETAEGDEEASAGGEASADEADRQATRITGVRITYPQNDKAVRHNGGNVPFRVAFEPEGATLPRGHRIEIVLDGEARARAPGTEVVVSPVNRGPHTARARVLDARGETRFESEPVKFFLLRKALGGGD